MDVSYRSGNQIAPVSPIPLISDSEPDRLSPVGVSDCVYLDPESPRTRALYVLFAPALRPNDAPLPPPSLKSPSPTEVSSDSLSPIPIHCTTRRVSSATTGTQPKFRSPCRRQSDISFALKGFLSDDTDSRFFRIPSPIPGVPTVITPLDAECRHYNSQGRTSSPFSGPMFVDTHPFSVESDDFSATKLSEAKDKARSFSHPRLNDDQGDADDSFRIRNRTDPQWDKLCGSSPRVAWS
ncbi:hypothetical protein AAVH_06981 [Aphelenchoides avenae]|nr:hypothetical protein AAVH_06981 [Aphelenchus avenae]